MNCCRLCSAMSRDAVPIFEEEGVNMKLAYKINKCLPLLVSLSDKLPRHVCRDCIDHLDSTSSFITKCLHTQFILEKKLRGKEDIPSDEVCVLWSNVNVESIDVPSTTPPNGSAIPAVVAEDNSHEEDSLAYCSPVNSPAASDEIEIVNQGKCNEKSENCAQGDEVSGNVFEEADRVEPLSSSKEKSKDSSGNVFQEKNNINSREKLIDKAKTCVSSGNDIFGNKENNVVSGQGRTKPIGSFLHRRQRKYNCKYCSSSFFWKAELFYHQTTSHPNSVFRCRYCLKVFYDSNEEYIKHVAAHKVTKTPQLTNKQLANSEMDILKQNVFLGLKYNAIEEEPVPKKKVNSNKRDEDLERMRVTVPRGKSIIDDVVKHLTEKKTGGKISGATNEAGEQCRKYKCDWCNNEHESEEDHRLHLRFHHKLRMPCRFCPRTICDKRQFMLHEASHKEEKKYKCRKCKIDFDTEKEWKEHKKFHFQEKPHRCKLCGEKFDQIWGLRQHSSVHREEKTCLCHKCGKSFRFQTSLRMHVKSCGEPPENAKKNVCKYCGKRYLVPSLLRIHERVHTGERPFMCSLCGKTFHSNEKLKNHSLSHVVENVPCPICGFVLKHRKHLKNHLKSHERVQCKTCALWFDGPRKLACHQRVHKKAQVVKEDRGVIVVSKRNVEEESSSEPQMMMRFPVVIELENPDLQVDEVQQGIENSKIFQPLDKPFACPHCPQKFVLHQSYLKHVKKHLNRKPLYCPDCGGKSQSMDELVRHYYTHFVGSKFYCDLCGESFDRKITMIEHKITHGIQREGDTLLRKRLLMLQPREPLVIPASRKSDVSQISIQQVENQVVVGNPDCDGGEFLTFDTHSVDSHCSEVIVVSSAEVT